MTGKIVKLSNEANAALEAFLSIILLLLSFVLITIFTKIEYLIKKIPP